MCNSIFISDKTIPEAQDDEEVEINIKGIYRTDENGVRKLDVLEVDGDPVTDPEEDESDCGCDDAMNQDSDDALRIFLIKKQKKD